MRKGSAPSPPCAAQELGVLAQSWILGSALGFWAVSSLLRARLVSPKMFLQLLEKAPAGCDSWEGSEGWEALGQQG